VESLKRKGKAGHYAREQGILKTRGGTELREKKPKTQGTKKNALRPRSPPQTKKRHRREGEGFKGGGGGGDNVRNTKDRKKKKKRSKKNEDITLS